VKILFIFGTRPEAIKMAPLIKKASANELIDCRVAVTAQHRQMLDQVLQIFDIVPDIDLNIMEDDQGLFELTSNIILNIGNVLLKEKPNVVLIQGDTTTAMVSSLAAFYHKIKIGHIEAGLRTWNKYSPFPEEMNRKLISMIADIHFCPTDGSKKNLVREGISEKKILVTGNTAIDALFSARAIAKRSAGHFADKFSFLDKRKKLVLVTGHRRENFGQGLLNICMALKIIARQRRNEVEIIYPVHLNPQVQGPVKKTLHDINNIHLIEPLKYLDFIYLMDRSYLIITDSGGVQEEAPSLMKPLLVTRDTTERPEGIEVGTAKLVGTDTNNIIKETNLLLDDASAYQRMASTNNPYGDGKAAARIIDFLVGIMGK
jgi:UDP-N-acetylglucosamine 2-epimerase (non-hydrolysing)